MPPHDTRGQTTLSRVADITTIRRPGNITVVAGAAERAVRNVRHIEVIAADTHLETELMVTDLATEPDTMEPVRKYHRAQAFLFGTPVEDNIRILGSRRHGRQNRENTQHEMAGNV